jgi:hypothetical protein
MHPILGMPDRKSRSPADDLRHQAAVPRVHVLHDHDDRSEFSR